MTSSDEVRRRYCPLGHIIDGTRRGRGGTPRRYCKACNVLAVARARSRRRRAAALKPRPQTVCPHCREPLEHDRDVPNEFCVTCDAWLHADCLAPHAAVRPTDGDWEHAALGTVEHYALHESCLRRINQLTAVLDEIAEECDQRADADCTGDPPTYKPNIWMQLHERIRAVVPR